MKVVGMDANLVVQKDQQKVGCLAAMMGECWVLNLVVSWVD